MLQLIPTRRKYEVDRTSGSIIVVNVNDRRGLTAVLRIKREGALNIPR